MIDHFEKIVLEFSTRDKRGLGCECLNLAIPSFLSFVLPTMAAARRRSSRPPGESDELAMDFLVMERAAMSADALDMHQNPAAKTPASPTRNKRRRPDRVSENSDDLEDEMHQTKKRHGFPNIFLNFRFFPTPKRPPAVVG